MQERFQERSVHMTKITIFSGFLGAGKTTLIKKLISEGYKGEKLVLIENEFGQIGIDGGFLQESGVEITEMNSGCICCSLVGDFGKALEQVISDYAPDRILIEPSGVGKLSDVIRAVQDIDSHDVQLDGFATVVDAKKIKMYQKNFGEFFNNQITYASCLILSHTSGLSSDKLDDCIQRIRELNSKALIVTTDWDKLTGQQIVDAITQKNTLDDELKELLNTVNRHEHEHGDDCGCHEHHHEHGDDCGCHEHHHEHDDDCGCDCHEHHHEHDEDCSCGCHEHEHHHHADDVFTSWGIETTETYTEEEISNALDSLSNEDIYGIILRAKGIVESKDGNWIHFDYIPNAPDVRTGCASTISRLCVIGSKINEEAIAKLFHTSK